MKYIKLFLGLLCLVVAWGLMKDYFDGPKRRAAAASVLEYEKLESLGLKTHGMLADSHRESRLSVLGVPTSKVYRIKYSFKTGGFTYDGVYKTKELPSGRDISVYYLPDDPKINAVNPASVVRDLKLTQRRFYAGVFMMLLMVLLVSSAFRRKRAAA